MHDLVYLHPALQLKVLKVLRDVSMLSANALEILQKVAPAPSRRRGRVVPTVPAAQVGAITVLVSLLDRMEGPYAQVSESPSAGRGG